MTTQQFPTATAPYIGAMADELSRATGADKVAAGVSQKALFHRRGDISLFPDRLVLRNWSDNGDLALDPADIESVEARFTELYGRFIGGLLNSGKPLIIRSVSAGEFYLLIDRKEFMESTDDLRWEKLIKTWLADHDRA